VSSAASAVVPDAPDTRPDPGGIQSAIDRYRDLAKYLITIFAGVGALLVAGTQLASIGELSLEDEPGRVVAVAFGLAAAVGAVAAIVALTLRVLGPVEMSFDEVVGEAELRAAIEARPWLLGGAGSLEEVRDNLATTALSDVDRETWFGVANDVVAYAAYLRTRTRFERTWWPLLGAAIIGVLGITVFTWGANPPEDRASSPVVEPVPVLVRISLTAAGREALGDALGGDACTSSRIAALAIGGTPAEPKVVTLPRGACKAAQFPLPPHWGAAIAED
jgi:hypothetical protein